MQAVNVVEGGTPDMCEQLLGMDRISTARFVCRGGEGKVKAAMSIPNARADWAHDGHASGAPRGDILG